MARIQSRTSDTKSLGSVLVVEDDAVLAMAIEDALRQAGAAEVTIVSTTAQALEALRTAKPDTLILDVHLADRDDGWAIAELVKEVGPHPPRIIFSTGAPGDIPAGIAELGAILEKPYDPADLVMLVRESKRKGLFSRLRDRLS